LQAVRQLGGIAWITDRNYGYRLIARWDLTVRSRLIDSKACHLMDNKPKRCGLDDEIVHRHARVMERVAIRRVIFELQFCDGQQQHRCTMRPFLIAFDQAAEQAIILRRILFRGDQEPPRLFVIRRRRPPCCFEKTPQLLRLDRPIVKGAWTPTPAQQVMDLVLRVCRFFHVRLSQDAEKARQLRSRVVQTLNVPQRVRLGSSLAAALLDGHFEHPS
jgi:hypothetical protein